MENASIWEEKTLINELIQGMELTKQLRVHLNAKSSTETRELLLQRILSSYDKALLILKWSESIGQPQPAAPLTGLPKSPVSGDGSPQSGDYGVFKDQADRKVVSKKRKVMPTRMERVRVCSENGLEGNNDDGYSWRKYGQKDILGAKFPRSYYRCTYRNVQDCWATKQVQRTDEDPTVFEITYKGQHTCNQINQSVPPPASPEKHETKHDHHHHHHNNHQQQNSDNILSSLRANLRVNTENLDNSETAPSFSFPSTSLGFFTSENQHFPMLVNDDLLRDYSPSFISPATSESNYFTESPCQMNNYRWANDLQHSQSSLTEMISANTSATNSPIGDLAFSTDYVDLDPNFPFTNSGFFT